MYQAALVKEMAASTKKSTTAKKTKSKNEDLELYFITPSEKVELMEPFTGFFMHGESSIDAMVNILSDASEAIVKLELARTEDHRNKLEMHLKKMYEGRSKRIKECDERDAKRQKNEQ